MTETKKSRISPFVKQCFVTSAVCSNIIGHGCCMGLPAVLLPQLLSEDSSIQLTMKGFSWIASGMWIALLVSNFIMPPIMGKLGRKIAHFSVSVPSIAGWGTIALASSFEMLIIGRILQGLSVGMMLPLRSVLIGEYTSPKNRGAFLTTVSFAQAFGIFFVHLIGSLVSWQQTAIICMLFSLLSLIMTVSSPESPSWLVDKGRFDEGRKEFQWLRGTDEETELNEMFHARISMEKEDIERNRHNCLRETVKGEFIRPITIMLSFYAMMHMAGGTTMAAFPPQIITMTVGPGVNSHFWTIALDTMHIVTNFGAIFAINNLGRRTMTFATGGISAVSHFAIAGYVFAEKHGYLDIEGTWLPLLIHIQFFCVAAGMGTLPSVIAGEIFPMKYKSLGGGISLTVSALFMFGILESFHVMVYTVGMDGTYLTFGCGICVCLVVIAALMPETQGKTLNEIEDELKGRPLRPERVDVIMPLQSDHVDVATTKMSAPIDSITSSC